MDHCRFLQNSYISVCCVHSDSLSWFSCQVLNSSKYWCYLHPEESLCRKTVSLIILLDQKWWIFVAKQKRLPTSLSFFIISSIQMIFWCLVFPSRCTESRIYLLCNKAESIKKAKINVWSVFSCFCSNLLKCRSYQICSSSGLPETSQMNWRERVQKKCSQGQSLKGWNSIASSHIFISISNVPW